MRTVRDFVDFPINAAASNFSELDDDGFSEASTLLKYDPANDIFFVSVQVSIFSVISTQDEAAGAVLADFRFAGAESDNQLTVFPENAGYSCGLQVQGVKLCGF